MMFKLSLISLCLLSVGNTLETTTILSSMTVSKSISLNSEATTNFQMNSKLKSPNIEADVTTKTTANHPVALIPTMIPNSKTNPNFKTSKPKTPKTSVTMKMTTVKSGGTTLNPKDNIHFLFYVIFLLFCVQ